MKELGRLITKDRKAQTLALLLGVMLLLNGGFYLLKTKPASDKASSLQTTLQANRRAILKKQARYRLYASFGRGKAQLESFKKMLPAKSDYTVIIKDIFKMAREDGVDSNSISVEKRQVAHGDIDQIVFSMPVSGSYRDVRKLIYDMENSSLFFTIDQLGFNGSSKTGDISVTLGLSTYVRS